MNNRRDFCLGLVAASLAALVPARAFASKRRRRRRKGRDHDDDDDDDDDDYKKDYLKASKARKTGDILPLKDILDEVMKTFPGDNLAMTSA